MAFGQAANPYDLLGQVETAAAPVHLHGDSEPRLSVGWGEFRQSFGSSLSATLTRATEARKFISKNFFKDSWIEHKLPRRAIVAAALWHFAILAWPLPQLSAPHRNPAFDNTVLTWSGPVEDLPLLEIPAAKAKSLPRANTLATPAPEGADAFHPRQRIFTDPVRPTHLKQTLINSKAPQIVPDVMPEMPNIVQLAAPTGPAKPKLQISEETFKKLRPKERKQIAAVTEPAPDVQNLEQRPAEISVAMNPAGPAKPKLELNAGSAPRVAQRSQTGEAVAAPDMSSSAPSAPNGSSSTIIALSALPAAPRAPVSVPEGNAAARIAISPEGKQKGTPGGSAAGAANPNGAGAGNGSNANPVGVSISGGNPSSNSSGLGNGRGKLNLSMSKPSEAASPAPAHAEQPATAVQPRNFAALAPGAKPESIFASKKVYTLHVNMPNLNSATGSWILSFSELKEDPTAPRVPIGNEIAAPQPVKKVDPKYPPTLIAEHVEGEVVLYAIIRKDGSVDGIQLVRGLDEQLDANAMRALAQWRFRPAEKQGETIDLEAIVHIPFHTPAEY